MRGRVRDLSRTARVWLLTTSLGLLTLLMWLAIRGQAPLIPGGPSVPLWLLAVAFGVAEVFVMHIRIARHAHSFSLSELPLVFGLALVSPGGLLLAQSVGLAVALAVRRQKPLRLAFNVAQRAATTLLAVVVLSLMQPILPDGWPAIWLAVFAATLVADVVGGMLINLAISLSEGGLRLFDQVIGVGTALTVTSTTLGLVTLMVYMQHPAAILLVAAPAVTIYFAGKAVTDLQRKHDDVLQLQGATQIAQRSLNHEDVIPVLLQHMREMFNADIAEVFLWLGDDGQTRVRYQVGPGDAQSGFQPTALDPTEGVWARVASEREAVLLPRPIRNDALRRFFGERHIRDAIVVPVSSDDDLLGILTIANRLGDFSTFDDDDVDLLQTLANHVAVAIRNALLLERLERALEHETEMSRLKDDFVATVSHELRTPITNVQGFAKTLLRPDVALTHAEQQEFLVAVDRNADRLERLIENLLFASRIESAERPSTNTDTIDLPGLIDRVVADESHGGVRGRIEVLSPDVLPSVQSVDDDVYRILRNLVDNALKYSPEDRPVTISTSVEESGIVVRVHDLGPGIDPEEQGRIFDRFYQVDQSTTRRVGGVGMGLYICRRAAEQLGAEVWLERSDARGSVFALCLPIDVRVEQVSVQRDPSPVTATA
jgi:signal transduction histidine kinase